MKGFSTRLLVLFRATMFVAPRKHFSQEKKREGGGKAGLRNNAHICTHAGRERKGEPSLLPGGLVSLRERERRLCNNLCGAREEGRRHCGQDFELVCTFARSSTPRVWLIVSPMVEKNDGNQFKEENKCLVNIFFTLNAFVHLILATPIEKAYGADLKALSLSLEARARARPGRRHACLACRLPPYLLLLFLLPFQTQLPRSSSGLI